MNGTIARKLGEPALESVVASLVDAGDTHRTLGQQGEQGPCPRKGYVLLALGESTIGLFGLQLTHWAQTVGELLLAEPIDAIAKASVAPAGLATALTLEFQGGERLRLDVPQSQQARLRRLMVRLGPR